MGWAVVAMSVFGAIQGNRAGKQMESLAREQELLAEENAVFAQKELDEQVRRQGEEDKRLRSTARARAAASGARLEGTPADYLDYMEEEQGRQLDWMQTAGASKIRLDLQGDKLRARALKLEGSNQRWSSLFQGFGSAAGYAGQHGLFSGGAS